MQKIALIYIFLTIYGNQLYAGTCFSSCYKKDAMPIDNGLHKEEKQTVRLLGSFELENHVQNSNHEESSSEPKFELKSPVNFQDEASINSEQDEKNEPNDLAKKIQLIGDFNGQESSSIRNSLQNASSHIHSSISHRDKKNTFNLIGSLYLESNSDSNSVQSDPDTKPVILIGSQHSEPNSDSDSDSVQSNSVEKHVFLLVNNKYDNCSEPNCNIGDFETEDNHDNSFEDSTKGFRKIHNRFVTNHINFSVINNAVKNYRHKNQIKRLLFTAKVRLKEFVEINDQLQSGSLKERKFLFTVMQTFYIGMQMCLMDVVKNNNDRKNILENGELSKISKALKNGRDQLISKLKNNKTENCEIELFTLFAKITKLVFYKAEKLETTDDYLFCQAIELEMMKHFVSNFDDFLKLILVEISNERINNYYKPYDCEEILYNERKKYNSHRRWKRVKIRRGIDSRESYIDEIFNSVKNFKRNLYLKPFLTVLNEKVKKD